MYVRRRRVAVCTSKAPLKNSVDTYTASAKRKDAARCLQGVGACGRIRTGDLLITSELLCQLSHTSINADGSIAYFAGAVNRFSGEESLFSAPPTSEVGTYRERQYIM